MTPEQNTTAQNTAAQNKQVALRFWEEVWNKGNFDVVYDTFAEDYVRHDLRPTGAPPGPAGQKKIAAEFRTAFPDVTWTVNLILAEGDLIAGRWTAEGTNTGPWGGVPPTGKKVRFCGVNIMRFRDGKVVEIWNHRDDLAVLEQIGKPVHAGSTGS